MSFIEFIGFIITLIAFLVLSMRRTKEPPSKSDEEGGSGQEEKLKKFLESLDSEMKEERHSSKKAMIEKKQVKIKPKPLKKQRQSAESPRYDTAMEDHRLKSNLEDHRFKSGLVLHQHSSDSIVSEAYRVKSTHAYDIVHKSQEKSKGKSALEHVRKRKDWLVIAEILKKPKAYD